MNNSSSKPRLGILASGSGTNLQKIIEAVQSGEIPAEISVVISNKEDAYALERARKHNISNLFINPKDFNSRIEYDKELIKILKSYDIDLIVMAGYMLVVTPEFIDTFKNRILNIHPALCPSFPGAYGVKDAFDYGVKVTGVTVHFADAGVDTGPIILQQAVPILEDDTEESLLKRIHEVEYKLFPQAIKLFCQGRLKIEGRKVKIFPE
ncbi:MAG: phosphoribosylglycinamide formyltransferase [Actinomycetia bacterium]|nr:phosphoribosylglycinamide formyltransferase [Actinomycetes bacterium]